MNGNTLVAARNGKLFSFFKRLLFLTLAGIAGASSYGLSQEARFLSFIHDTHISSALICSPDGKNIYASGIHTIAVFARNPNGTIACIQVLNNDHLGIENLHHIIDMAVSLDGRHLYAVSASDQSLLIFARDPTTGKITLQEAIIDNVFGNQRKTLPVIERKFKLFFSPDGKHLYWFYGERGVVAVFARETTTGRLTKIQMLLDGATELDGNKVPWWIAITPDGKHVYGGGKNGAKIIILSRDGATGKIKYASSHDIGRIPNDLWELGNIEALPDTARVLVTNYTEDVLLVFARDLATGALLLTQEITRNAPDRLVMSPEGNDFYLRHYDSGSYFAHYKLNHSSNRFVLSDDRALQIDFRPPQPPSGICMSPQGDAIYMTSEVGRTVIRRDTSNGELSIIQHFQHNVGGTDRLYGARAVVVSPDGDHLYLGTRFEDAGVSVFARDHGSGQLTLVEKDSLPHVSAMNIAPDGNHLYATSADSGTITVFARNRSNGKLQLVQTRHDSLNADVSRDWAGTMSFSPDAQTLYLHDANKLRIYTRHASTGTLTPFEILNGQNFGLGELHASAISSEGKFFYWNSVHPLYYRYQLATFTRDPVSGLLTFVSKQEIQRVSPGNALRISPDGRHVYAATWDSEDCRDGCDGDATLRIFARDIASGELTFLEKVSFPEWCETRDLEISATGDEVYILFGCPGYYFGEVAIFTRDAITGKLAPKQQLESWKDGVYGIISPTDLALTPDEKFMYVSDLGGVATFTTGRNGTNAVQENNLLEIPRTLTLEQNYPNPFSTLHTRTTLGAAATTIHYEIPATAPVELAIYNLLGQRVQTLVNKLQSPGRYSITWSGINANGQRVHSGIYFYRIKAGASMATRRLAILD